MTDTITLTGLVATTPRHLVTSEGLPITSFRLASTQRRYDRAAQKWIDGETNWYTITAFRHLAVNVVGSVAKGQRVVVTGRLRLRDWNNGERAGMTVEVDADALGHDLAWGTAVFTRSVSSSLAHDDELPSDRAAALEEEAERGIGDVDESDAGGSGAVVVTHSGSGSGSGSDDELSAAPSKRPAEVALPF